MAATSLQSPSKSKLLDVLSKKMPKITFLVGKSFYWSPETNTISYVPGQLQKTQGVWTLLHEAGHAQRGHNSYSTDFELLQLEVEAWEAAKKLGNQLGVSIDENYLQDCVDTYRDWLHQRSTCPTCGTNGLQSDSSLYTCHNCTTSWSVSISRFCRAYRQKTGVAKSQTTTGPRTFQ